MAAPLKTDGCPKTPEPQMSDSTTVAADSGITFAELNLSPELLRALDGIGYEKPSPIQAEAIPYIMQGCDILGHAPTGTGKTGAFALPLLSRLDMSNKQVQIMTLCPTRELAIQVAEAYKAYAAHIEGFNVLPIYGGQEYQTQIRQLNRGVQVVVGTPGRVMDHMKRGTLKLNGLQAMVLDEADEMLRMGFIDDVEWILEQTPDRRQMALFSATMPPQVERIARKYLHNPKEVSIKAKSGAAETIRQRFWPVKGFHKLDALTRILEFEKFDAIIIFVRTKSATTEIAEKLEARGYAASALNGDMVQKDRERMIERLKSGSLDILVATDVAARGLDVERISHVINYDIPYDGEAYIHRIGRTGRAGRQGDAILFVAPRERRMLSMIEKTTRKTIEQLVMPSTEMVNNKRIADFKQKITDTLAGDELAFMRNLIEQYRIEHDVPSLDIAAALAQMSLGDQPLLLKAEKPMQASTFANDDGGRSNSRKDRNAKRGDSGERGERGSLPPRGSTKPDADKERYRIEVGYDHGVKPGNIVGAIANEAGLDGNTIGQIDIQDSYSFIDLPKGMPAEVFKDLQKTRVCGQPLRLSLSRGGKDGGERSVERKSFDRNASGKKPFERKEGVKKPFNKNPGDRKFSDKKPGDRKFSDKKPGDRKFSDKKPGEGSAGGRPSSDRDPFAKPSSAKGKPVRNTLSAKPGSSRPAAGGSNSKPAGKKFGGPKPAGKTFGGKKPGGKSFAGKKPGPKAGGKPANRKG